MSGQPKIDFRDLNAKTETEVLARVHIFESLKNEDGALEFLADCMRVKKLEKGDTLLTEGDPGTDLFILTKGLVSIYKKTPDGDTFKVAILGADQLPVLGESGIVTDELRSATVVCDDSCQVLVLSRKDFDCFANQNPKWALPIFRKITGMLAGRLKKLNHDLILLHEALTKEIRGS